MDTDRNRRLLDATWDLNKMARDLLGAPAENEARTLVALATLLAEVALEVVKAVATTRGTLTEALLSHSPTCAGCEVPSCVGPLAP
jgi:hypothetical protein